MAGIIVLAAVLCCCGCGAFGYIAFQAFKFMTPQTPPNAQPITP